jgi:tetratricopeptide (TPR) repeat protein
VYLDQRRFAEAREQYAAALAGGANPGEARRGLAQALAGLGQWNEALYEAQAAATAEPGAASAEVLGDIHQSMGNREEACRSFRRAASAARAARDRTYAKRLAGKMEACPKR